MIYNIPQPNLVTGKTILGLDGPVIMDLESLIQKTVGDMVNGNMLGYPSLYFCQAGQTWDNVNSLLLNFFNSQINAYPYIVNGKTLPTLMLEYFGSLSQPGLLLHLLSQIPVDSHYEETILTQIGKLPVLNGSLVLTSLTPVSAPINPVTLFDPRDAAAHPPPNVLGTRVADYGEWDNWVWYGMIPRWYLKTELVQGAGQPWQTAPFFVR